MVEFNEINILYILKNNDKKNRKIRIFRNNCVNNNKNKCKLIMNKPI